MKKLLVFTLFSSLVSAGDIDLNKFSSSLDYAQVKRVTATQKPNGSWCFSTTVSHNDAGWEHYADGWQVTDLQGNELGNRLLAHPHNNEQPFTRRLCDISIPENIDKIIIRAKCNVHDYGGKVVLVDLSRSEGVGYSVQRAQ